MPGTGKRRQIAFDLDPDEQEQLRAAAQLAGIPASTLARGLFRWAWALFGSEGFNVMALKQRFGEGADLVSALDPNRPRREKPAKPKAS